MSLLENNLRILKILSALRCCALCGFPQLRGQDFCDFCLSKLRSTLNEYSTSRSPFKGIDSLALWNWDERNDETLRRFLLAQKGHRGLPCFRRQCAEWLVARGYSSSDCDYQGWLIVPAPAKSDGELDHAGVLAQQISSVLGRPLVSALRRGENRQMQKSLSKRERFGQSRHRLRPLNPGKKYKSVIFVDDVITTGATASRAYEALGFPEEFQVWTLARRFPCGASGNLLQHQQVREYLRR